MLKDERLSPLLTAVAAVGVPRALRATNTLELVSFEYWLLMTPRVALEFVLTTLNIESGLVVPMPQLPAAVMTELTTGVAAVL